MFEEHNTTIYDIVRRRDLVNPEQLGQIEEARDLSGKSLVDELIDADLIDAPSILKAIAEHFGCEYLPEYPSHIDGDTLEAIPSSTARMYGVIPYKIQSDVIELIAKDPFNHQIVDDLGFTLDKQIELVVVNPEQFDAFMDNCYGVEDASIDSILDEIHSDDSLLSEGAVSEAQLQDLANETPIVRFVNLILQQAVRDKSSDIHFEPFEDEFRIRYRIDGTLYEMTPPPKSLALAIISRLKVLSNLNIAESRVPQDGRIRMTISGHVIDLRVSTLPIQDGESVVLRILDKSAVKLDLEALSMSEATMEQIRSLVRKPNGIFIVTGPTGSGKTTTLYSALREVNEIDVKILTAEDPVEYEIEGLVQISTNHDIGLTFSSILRAFLRQDPDKIMIGEIRDLETGRIAVQASLTGHVVLSTLHTNSAPAAVTRLVDIGVEPYLIAAALEGVLAQRLLRRICPSCKTPYTPAKELIERLKVRPEEVQGKQFYYGKGDESCGDSGYRGRQGLFEMMMINKELENAITQGLPTLALHQKAVEVGMVSLRQDGLRAMFEGNTSIEEVLKYT